MDSSSHYCNADLLINVPVAANDAVPTVRLLATEPTSVRKGSSKAVLWSMTGVNIRALPGITLV